ncbi:MULTISPECIES: hypothetical protein [unclassified Haloferax]|uniref:ComF family protein n=1 Tax=unclassified Haloferax TaxID=2625095 RepID=UPI0028742C8E|nr:MULTISPECIES: hypothetical protein [unclassified Haloferax]MDS0242724.1 hypothetical protein [Haloferax sp. S2CR25]MDS0445845.1 hypothetical protein [Haloferax sp. S2CR25-2]
MSNYTLNRDAALTTTIDGSTIVIPFFQCNDCGSAISEHYAGITGRCSSCTREDNQTEGLEQIHTVTIYLPDEDRTNSGVVGDISKFSDQIYEAKGGKHVTKMSNILKYGIDKFDELSHADLIVYPPSGEGGDNHMKQIAEELSSKTMIPSADVTEKAEDYPSQKSTDSLDERISNIQGKIGIRQTSSVNFEDVDQAIIVDDVVVTGSTMSNTAQVLLQEGVSQVYGLGITRNEALNHLICSVGSVYGA